MMSNTEESPPVDARSEMNAKHSIRLPSKSAGSSITAAMAAAPRIARTRSRAPSLEDFLKTTHTMNSGSRNTGKNLVRTAAAKVIPAISG